MWFLIAMIASVLVGAGLAGGLADALVEWLGLAEWMSEVGSSFGEALMVAGLLGITVDRYTKDKLSKEIAADAFRAFWGMEQPLNLRDEVTSSVMKQAIYRRDYKVDVRLERDSSGYLKSTTIATYRAVNTTIRPVNYPIRVFVEKCAILGAPESRIEAVSTRGLPKGQNLKYDGNVPTAVTERRDLEFSQNVMIPARGGRGEVFVRVQWVQYVGLEDDHSFSLVYSTENVEAQLTVPEGFEGGIRFRHPDQAFEAESSRSPYVWKKSAFFLPWQGLMIWWRPKPDPDGQGNCTS